VKSDVGGSYLPSATVTASCHSTTDVLLTGGCIITTGTIDSFGPSSAFGVDAGIDGYICAFSAASAGGVYTLSAVSTQAVCLTSP
jgi:hypothetical protein